MDFFILQPPYIYFIILGAVFGIGLAIWKKQVLKDKFKGFVGQTLNEVIEHENLKPYMESFSRKTKHGKLIKDFNVIDVSKIAKAKLKYYEMNNGTSKDVEADFFIFQGGKSLFSSIPILRRFAGNPEYYIINSDENYILKDAYRDVWSIKDGVFFYKLAGIWIVSQEGQNFISELTYKKIYENMKEEDMNYPKRIVWYNDKYAYNMTDKEKDYELEQKKWKDRVERETGVRK